MRRLCLLGAFVLGGASALSAQSVLERTPNIHGTWGLQSGQAAFAFAHRFEFIEGGDEMLNIPTLSLAVGLPLGLMAGLEYSSNSEIRADAQGSNEAEYYLKRPFPIGSRSAVAGIVAYNGQAESFDAALSARTELGRLGLMGELRGFTDLFATGEAGAAGTVGAVVKLTPFLGVVGDVGKVLSADSFDAVWSAGLGLAIPGSPHTLSLHATNGGAMTLQGSTREKTFGPEDVRYGFTFTIPLGNGSQWARIFRPARATAPSTSGAVQVPMRMIAYVPPEIRIRAGQSVEWINQDPTPHTVTGEGWASEIILEGGRYTRRFDQPGRYPYRCLPHPQMTGVVIVE